MMIAEVASIWNVSGRRRAIDPEGPMPGRTPTAVPIKTPKKHARSFIGARITENL
jgi:hypothetical protein